MATGGLVDNETLIGSSIEVTLDATSKLNLYIFFYFVSFRFISSQF